MSVTNISETMKEVPKSTSFFCLFLHLNLNLTRKRLFCMDKMYTFAENINKSIYLNSYFIYYEENFTRIGFTAYDNGFIRRGGNI